MNLVQINERLKEMPMQAVQQYANGMNPEVPPYLALGELQRRQNLQKQMSAGQGAATGQPSIKEQVEQKAGLLALQGAQMQQQQQQMLRPRPGPVPAGVPQPEPQPEAEGMMGGGLARIPVRDDLYRFAGGGIIAFQAGGQPQSYETPYDRMNRLNREEEESRRRQEEVGKRTLSEEERRFLADELRKQGLGEDISAVPGMEAGNLYAAAMREAKGEPRPRAVERPSMVEQIPTEGYRPVAGGQRVTGSELDRNVINTLAAMPGAGVMRGPTMARMAAAGLAGLAGKGERPQAPAAQAAPAAPTSPAAAPELRRAPFEDPRRLDTASGQGLAALSMAGSAVNRTRPPAPPATPRPASPMQAAQPAQPAPAPQASATQPAGMEFVERARQDLTPQTTEQLLAERRRLMAELAPGQYGEDAIKRAEERRRQYEAGKPSGLDELIRVFGQAGQYKGLSGLAPAYTQMQAQKRAQDLKYAEEEEKTRALIDAARRAEGLAGVEGITKGAETSRTRAAQTAATLAAQEMQSRNQENLAKLDRESRAEIARIDREFQERMKKIPQAQAPSLEREMLEEYAKQFGSRTKAFEHMKTMLQENKAELNQPQLVRQYADQWAKMDALARNNYAKQGINTVEDYINYMTKLTSGVAGGKSGKSPALPPGFKLD